MCQEVEAISGFSFAQLIEEQLLFATAQRDGQIYAPKRLKNVTDKVTGERKTVEATKRIKEWYWTNSTGMRALETQTLASPMWTTLLYLPP